MGQPWVDHPSWEVVGEASEVAGRDLAALLLHAPMEELTATANAQLATFVQSLVVLDAVERLGLAPAATAGHSLGEYSALVACGAISFADGIRLVSARGEAMGRAIEDATGTMAVLMGIGDDDADAACQRAEDEVWVANYNAPGQVVIAGTPDAVARAGVIARGLGAKRVTAIPVAGAFHTPLMAAARPALRKTIAEVAFLAPEVPVIANVDARRHDSAEEWPGLLSAQLCSPVRWRQVLETLAALGASVLLELGPGGVLSGLARRSVPQVASLSIAQPDDLDSLMDTLRAPEAARDAATHPGGEHLYTSERVVVSPSAGVFAPAQILGAAGAGLLPGTAGPDSRVAVGDLVGRVGDADVRTPFGGELMWWLVAAGDRVQQGQPVLWLRVLEEDQ